MESGGGAGGEATSPGSNERLQELSSVVKKSSGGKATQSKKPEERDAGGKATLPGSIVRNVTGNGSGKPEENDGDPTDRVHPMAESSS